jgi:hypothetical protein
MLKLMIMKRIFTLLISGLLTAYTFAQAPGQMSNLVIYAEQGETFTVKLNGQLKNEVPQTNVKIQNLNMAKYLLDIDFTDATLPNYTKDVYLNPGYEVVYAIKKNNKGEYVLRPQSQTPLTTTMTSTTTAMPNNNVSYNQNTNNTQYRQTTTTSTPNNNVTYSQTTTTTTVPNANMNVNLSNPGVNVNINVTDPTLQSNTTYTQTTTTTTSSTGYNNATVNNNVSTQNTNTRCAYPMNSTDFEAAVNSINSKSFDDTKLTVAKQIINSNCLKTAQVKRIMSLFSFEDTKLDLAKYSYMHTYDPQNYFQLNDAFSYSSSVDDLNTYINGLR